MSTRVLQFVTGAGHRHTTHTLTHTHSGSGSGNITLFKDCSLDALLDQSQHAPLHHSHTPPLPSSSSSSSPPLPLHHSHTPPLPPLPPQHWLDPTRINEEKTHLEFTSECVVCIVSVPSFMIPHDILQYLSPVLHDIKAITTLKHYYSHEQYYVLLKMKSEEDAARFIREYHGAPLCSLQPTTCLAYSVRTVTHNTVEPSNHPVVDHTVSNEQKSTEQYPDSSISSSDKSSSGGQDGRVSEEEICAICLAPFESENPVSFTTCCGHTFHILCTQSLENSQCPVCRTQLDDAAMDSQSRCAVCSWPHPPVTQAMSSSTTQTQQQHWTEGDQDLWVCLVCGFIGCGEAHNSTVGGGGHMREHYQQHLHAYAMNTETRRVWDFAGEGYVHRLILNQHEDDEDGVGSPNHRQESLHDRGTTRDGPSLKIVEINRPTGTAGDSNGWERSQVPPLSQQQEDFVVTRKLETAAEHFSAVLAWKLEQQREHFESKLARLRSLNESHSHKSHDSSCHSSSSSSSTDGEDKSASRAKHIILNLKNEKQKLLRQTELAHERIRATIEDRTLLSTFTANLSQNQQEWEGRALVAKEELQAAEDSYRTHVPLLERQVRTLMQRFDDGTESAT